ncbi:LysR family transcriptional regulator [Dongia mobilis]|uniref:LysR family transcriptional regulator n=1 Tax=Dongia mobilis TaxID=578943 RepID=A0A4V3DF83_9PROT|nr:LysR family transcriptional regulator [Dongia mobilis]TDQ84411.1 LysR family transcriptional regulator [Dongia mobilis]
MANALEWNDYRVVLAIQRTGGLAPAARLLGVNHATVFRQVNAMEARLGARLFDRHRSGYGLTAVGEVALAAAEVMETQVLAAERRMAGGDLSLNGTIRVTAPDDMVEHLLLPIFADFQGRYPQIELEIIVDNRFLNLSRREADIAIRPTAAAPEAMVGVNVGPLAMAIYGAAALADRAAAGARVTDLPWVGWEDGADSIAFGGYFRRLDPRPAFLYRANSLLAQISAVERGLGVALLPCFAGDSIAGLVRIGPPDSSTGSFLWLLTHPDLRRAARIRAFIDFVAAALRRKRRLLAGS